MDPDNDSSSDTFSAETEFEVESIEGKREFEGVIHYFIKWKNYPFEQNTWEPVWNLSCEELIQEYEENHPEPVQSKVDKMPKKRKIEKKKPQRKRTKKVNVHDTMFDTIPQFRHSDELERIYDMKRFGGDIKYLVQYKDCDEPEWISVTIIKRTFPHKVIEFYEKCITWEN